jgi:hypothetical protein
MDVYPGPFYLTIKEEITPFLHKFRKLKRQGYLRLWYQTQRKCEEGRLQKFLTNV